MKRVSSNKYTVINHYPEPDKEDEFNKRVSKSWLELIIKKLSPKEIEQLKRSCEKYNTI